MSKKVIYIECDLDSIWLKRVTGVTPELLRSRMIQNRNNVPMTYRHHCPICNRQFSRRWNMERHIGRNHSLDIKYSLFQSQNTPSKTPTFKTQKLDRYNSSNIFSLLSLYLPNNNNLPNAQVSTATKKGSSQFEQWHSA